MAGVSDSLFQLSWRSVPDLPGPPGLSGAQPPAWAVCHRVTRRTAGQPVQRRDPHRPGHLDPFTGAW